MNEIKSALSKDRFQRRHFAEILFRLFGLSTIVITCFFLICFLLSIILSGLPAFKQTTFNLPLNFNADYVKNHQYDNIIRQSLEKTLKQSNITNDQVFSVLSEGGIYKISAIIKNDPGLIGKEKNIWLVSSDKMHSCITKNLECSDFMIHTRKYLEENNSIRTQASFDLLLNTDSREAEIAGMKVSIIGSLMTVLICMSLAFPLAMLSAIYLEEFAPKNKLTSFIEVNINNLAAVPSIVFGIVGLAIFLGIFHLPRSSSLVAGLTLSFMALPTMIITTRQSISSVPTTIKLGAMALGASKVQILFHHTFRYALPGILTGAVLTICRVVGETAPMIMIGMVAFIADVPQNFLDPATVMPVQIYLWAESPEGAFKAKTFAAITILLAIVFTMNILTLVLRKKYEHKW